MTDTSKNQLDLLSDSLPESELKEKIDSIIEKWRMGPGGQPKNLLLLLSSLHEVWSIDKKLKDIKLKDLYDDTGLATRVYKRCMLQFHVDKTQSLNLKYQLIAKQIYYVMTQANETYRK
jgi:hypothetical protein